MVAIDISRYQGTVDFPTLAASGRVELVIAKLGGSDAGVYIDPMWATNRDGARRVGLPLGSYFFNGPGDTPTQAADLQFQNMDWRPGDKAMIDVEGRGIAYTPAQAVEWALRMMSHGVPAGSLLAYMSESVENSQDWSQLVNLGVQLDVASYGMNTGLPGNPPRLVHWKSWALWQYTSVGTIARVNGHVDVSLISSAWASTNVTPLTTALTLEDPMICIGLDYGLSSAVSFSISPGLLQRHATVRQQQLAGSQGQGGPCYWYSDDDFVFTMINHGLGEFGVADARALQGNGHLIAKAVFGAYPTTLTATQIAQIAAQVKPTVDLSSVTAAVAAVAADLTALDAASQSYHADLAATLAKGFTITGTVKP